MPLVRVTLSKGCLSTEQRSQLAEEMTGVLLLVEGGTDNPAGRAIAYVLFNEVDPADWYIGGRLDETYVHPGGRFIFDVTVPQGSCNQERKNQVHAAVNDSLCKILGLAPDKRTAASAWVIIHEVREGHWGAAGRMVGIRNIAQFAQMAPDRADYFEPLLAAQKKLHEAHGFPEGTGSY